MKIRKEYIALGIIVIALLLYLFLHKTDKTHYQLPKIDKIYRNQINRIEISKTDQQIVMSKNNASWVLLPQGFPVDNSKKNAMLDVFETLKLTALASESKNYASFDLGESKRIDVKAYEGDRLALHFEVGKTVPSHKHTFVKLAGDDRVFHAKDNFRGKFDQSADDLRDKTVLSFKKDEIYEITIRQDKETVIMSKQQAPVNVSGETQGDTETLPEIENVIIWKTDQGKIVDETQLDSLLSTLSDFKCDAFIDGKKKEDFSKPIYSLKIVGEQDYSISIFDKEGDEDKNYPAVSSESDYPFLISKWKAENIMKKPADLEKKEDNK